MARKTVNPKTARKGGKPGPKKDGAAVKKKFLAAYAEGGTIAYAAEAAGVSRDIHYYWIKTDLDYKEAFWHAEEESIDELEEVARTRAVEGSDVLLKFMLEGKRRSVFGRRTELTGAAGGPITISHIERVIVDPEDKED